MYISKLKQNLQCERDKKVKKNLKDEKSVK